MIRRLAAWFKNLPAHLQVMIILIPLLILAILLSLDRILEGISKGFMYFSR
ncbi:MAG TPA: hypothetical protein P5167_00590 [Bacteroidales bacterium]|nr:hypothetical protein [Bacteroidales bacterium]HRW94321.1 hypothetical protein [Bacteroidales bacterium]